MIFNKEAGSPWGTPPGGGNGNGSGRGPTPPDIDKIIRRVSRKNKKIFTWWKFIWRQINKFNFNHFRFCLAG